MDYKKDIEELMENLSERKKELAVLKKVGGDCKELEKRLKFLEFCFTLLDKYEKELIFSVCINGISIRKYADHTGLSRNFISKEKNKIIAQFDKFFKIKYESDKICKSENW